MRAVTRRQVLGGLLGVAGTLATARALVPLLPPRRFVFVINRGGWDPLTSMAPLFGRPQIAMPLGAQPATAGDLAYVASAQRPAVTAFFEQHAARTALLHGISVRSVSHEICERTLLTGAATGDATDMATRLAAADPGRALPHLVLAGPSFPGDAAARVARAGETGQLQSLVDGSLRTRSDAPTAGLSGPASRLVDHFVKRRTAAAADGRAATHGDPGLRGHLVGALDRAERLLDLRWDVDYTSDGTLPGQLAVAGDLLERGLAQCVTVSPLLSWDTHTDSDNQQSALHETLFAGLDAFCRRLESTTGPSGAPLASEITVVVLSEMARTPQLNADQGRDHWPWTTALLWGAGVSGGRAFGGYDDGYAGMGIDPASGQADPGRPAPTPAELAASLMVAAGLSPDLGPGVAPIPGLLV